MTFKSLSPINFNGQRLTNIGTPTADTDGVSRGYVDSTTVGRWRGNWTSDVTPPDGLGAYLAHDVTTYQGTTYRASTTPDSNPPLNSVKWDVLALAGTNGSNGSNGVSFTFQGAWVSGTPYIIGQWVSYGGSLYYCNGGVVSASATPNTDAGWNLGMTGGAGGLAAGSAPQSSIRANGYVFAMCTSIANSSTISVNQASAAPVYIPKDTTADKICLYVQTPTATALWRLGIFYDAGGSYLYPGTLVVDGGTIDASSGGGAAGVRENNLSSISLIAGVYWLAAKAEVAHAPARGNVGPIWGVTPSTNTSTGDLSSGYVANHGSSGWTSPWPSWGASGTGTVQNTPRVGIRVAG